MTTGRPSRAEAETPKPHFRDLSTAAALRVLRRNHVGRIAYTLHDSVEVLPIHYVTDGQWLYLRTSPGMKTSVLERNRWLAFQTDEVESAFTWRSVLVRGTAYTLSSDSPPDLARRYARAVNRISAIVPWAFGEDDPVSFRTVILGIHIDEISGREAWETHPRRGAAKARKRSAGRRR